MSRMVGVRRLLVAAAFALVVLGTAACGGSIGGRGDAAAPAGSASSTVATPSPAPRPSVSSSARASAGATTEADQGPQPLPDSTVHVTSVTVDAIGLRTSGLETLTLLADQTLSAPKDPDKAGWYADGAVPGQTGPAVIAGHVDSKTGPAVFAALGQTKRGDKITIGLSDKTTATFRVDKVVHTAKDAFPTDAVYGPTPDAQLRLITCSGTYDRGGRGYLDNTVVFATAVDAS